LEKAEMKRSFDALIEQVANREGWRRLRSAADMVAAWESFVAQCEKGYDMNIYEYENDRAVRGMLEKLFANTEIRGHPKFAELRDQVETIDARLKALFEPRIAIAGEDRPWWERGVPRFAGPELASDFNQMFGVLIDTVKG
jgi:hypothetical protein